MNIDLLEMFGLFFGEALLRLAPILIGLHLVFSVLPHWLIFRKAGEHGWAALIPFYRTYIYYKIVFGNGAKMFLLLIPVYNIVLWIQSAVRLGRVFGKSGGFCAGLFFLRPLFLLILAFGKAQYCKAGEAPDEKASSSASVPHENGQSASASDSLCRQCGAPLRPGAAFCPKCGMSVGKAALSEETAPAVCKVCGAKLKPGAKFCEACGSELAEQESPDAALPQQKAAPAPAAPDAEKGLEAQEKTAEPKPKKSRKRLLIGLASGVMAAVLLITALWQPGFVFLIRDSLSARALEKERMMFSEEKLMEKTVKFRPEKIRPSGSKAVKIKTGDGLVVSADKNALDRDRDFHVEKVELAEILKAYPITEERIWMPVAGYEVDAGLADTEQFPGCIELEFDLKKLGIDKKLWETLSVVRIGDDGSMKQLVSELHGSKISCESRQNSTFVLSAILAGLSAELGREEWAATAEQNKLEDGPYYRIPFQGKYASYAIAFTENQLRKWDKQKNGTPGVMSEVDVKIAELQKEAESMRAFFAENPGAAAAADGYGTDSSRYDVSSLTERIQSLKNSYFNGDWTRQHIFTEEMSIIEEKMKIADQYLFGERGFRVPSYQIDIYISEKDTQNYALTVNLHSARPFIIVFTGGNFRQQPDEALLTMTHELFHVAQNEYSLIRESNTSIPFSEATAAVLEREAAAYYNENGIVSDGQISPLQAISFDTDLPFPLLTPNRWFTTQTDSLNILYQHHGYAASGFLDYIREATGAGIGFVKAIMEHASLTENYPGVLAGTIGGTEEAICTLYFQYLRSKRPFLLEHTYDDLKALSFEQYLKISPEHRYVQMKIPYGPLSCRTRELTVEGVEDQNYTIALAFGRERPSDRQLLQIIPFETKYDNKDIPKYRAPKFCLNGSKLMDLGMLKSMYLFEINDYISDGPDQGMYYEDDMENVMWTSYDAALLMQPEDFSYQIEGDLAFEKTDDSERTLVISLPEIAEDAKDSYAYTVNFYIKDQPGHSKKVPHQDIFDADVHDTELRFNVAELKELLSVKSLEKVSFTLCERWNYSSWQGTLENYEDTEKERVYGPESTEVSLAAGLEELIGTYTGTIKFRYAEVAQATYEEYAESESDEDRMSKGECDRLYTGALKSMKPDFRNVSIEAASEELKANQCHLKVTMRLTNEEENTTADFELSAPARYDGENLVFEADGEPYILQVKKAKNGEITLMGKKIPFLYFDEEDPELQIYIYCRMKMKKDQGNA